MEPKLFSALIGLGLRFQNCRKQDMFLAAHVTFHLRAQPVEGIPQRRQALGLVAFGGLNLIEQVGDQRKILAPPPAVLPQQSLDDACG